MYPAGYFREKQGLKDSCFSARNDSAFANKPFSGTTAGAASIAQKKAKNQK
jgi:hypothetical protein